MNDQQSPSAPDPYNNPTPQAMIRTRRRSALSDQEAFSILAESMADDRNGNGTASASPTRTPVAPLREDRSFIGDMPPVVPFRIDSTPFDDASTGELSAAPTAPADPGGSPGNESSRILVDGHWELVDHVDAAVLCGRITEVIDLSCIPPLAVEPDSRDVHHRIVPPVEESHDPDSLPPLVFLNTRGDIMPRVGEAAPGDNGIDGNGDRFDGEVVAWNGGGPPTATTTSGSGVESMADPRGDIEALADTVEPPSVPYFAPPDAPPGREPFDPIDQRLIDDDDTQLFHQDTAGASTGSFVDLTFGDVHPESHEAPDPAPMAPSLEIAARLDELQRIFDQYSGPVIAVIASIAADRRAIDEALQSTFEAVWKTDDTDFDSEQPRGPWMFTLARRQAIEQVELSIRHDREQPSGRYPVPSHRQDAAISVDKSWEAWEVRLAVDQLTPAEHDVLRLIHNEGLIHPEIAAQLHTTVGAVKSHAYSGSHRLVELLDHVIRPDAAEGLTVDQASALTWYLAGVADGSDLDSDERAAVKRVQAQLASATAWINPDAHASERVISFARRTIDDPGPPTSVSGAHPGLAFGHPGSITADGLVVGSTGQHAEVVTPDEPKRRHLLIGVICALALLAVVVTWSLISRSSEGGTEIVRQYEMQPSGLDPDATGLIEITTVSTGSRFELEFDGLDATTDDQFYTAWLQNTAGGGVVPLGSFSWPADADPMVLSGPVWSDAYDVLIVTRGATMTRASVDDPPVLSVSIE